MALPTPSKTWQISKNLGPFTSLPSLERAWKNALIGATLGAWTVVRSCGRVGGTTWTAGAADYWATDNAIVHANAGSSHAWIVLKQTGIGSNFQICLDLQNNSGGSQSVHYLFVSPSAGFTGGTTTARPTATDEINCNAKGTGQPEWTNAQDLTVAPARLNVFQSTDGECTRWSIWRNNYQTCFAAVDKPRNPVVGWTTPWVLVIAPPIYNDGQSGNLVTYAQLHDLADGRTYISNGSTRGLCYLTSEAAGGNNKAIGRLMTFGGDLDAGAFPICPIGIYCETSGVRGRLGELYDLWWGSTILNDGDHYPADATRLFVQLNDLVHAWGGGAALIKA